MKKRFKVLLLAQEYSLATQALIVPALAALHNLIIVHDPGDISLHEDETIAGSNADDAWSTHQAAISREERTRANDRRDQLAMAMWNDYIARAARRRR